MPVYRCGACGAVTRLRDGALEATCPRCRRPLDLSGRAQRVDAAALVSAIRCSPAPVLVGFCGAGSPPVIDSVPHARDGEIVVLAVDTDAEPAAAHAFGIGRSPTVVLFSGGSEVLRAPRVPAAAELTRWVEHARAAAS